MHTREKESDHFSRMSDHETIGSGVNEKINANLGRLDRNVDRILVIRAKNLLQLFVIRKGTKFYLRANDPYVLHRVS